MLTYEKMLDLKGAVVFLPFVSCRSSHPPASRIQQRPGLTIQLPPHLGLSQFSMQDKAVRTAAQAAAGDRLERDAAARDDTRLCLSHWHP